MRGGRGVRLVGCLMRIVLYLLVLLLGVLLFGGLIFGTFDLDRLVEPSFNR